MPRDAQSLPPDTRFSDTAAGLVETLQAKGGAMQVHRGYGEDMLPCAVVVVCAPWAHDLADAAMEMRANSERRMARKRGGA